MVMIVSFSLISFTNKKNDECLLVVGLATKYTKCTSGGVTNSFSESIGYQYQAKASPDRYDYTQVSSKIKYDLASYYNIPERDVTIKTSSSSVAVIISYEKDIAGWNCSVTKYAVGFGDSEDEAEAEAVNQKKYDYARSSYNVVKTINCN